MHRIFQTLNRLSGKRAIFPFYHLVADDAPAHIQSLYQIRSVREFNADLEFLLKHYEPLSFHDWSSGKRTTKPAMVLSFDDGLREVYDCAAPILKQKGIPAILFINSGFVENAGLFYRYQISVLLSVLKEMASISKDITDLLGTTSIQKIEAILTSFSIHDQSTIDRIAELIGVDWNEYLNTNLPYMDLEQLKTLSTTFDFTIGAHSVDHPKFQDIPRHEQYRQIEHSMAYVKSHFRPAQKLFAFPFTDFGVGDDLIRQIQVDGIVDYSFGTAGIKNESIAHHIQRIPMEVSGVNSERTLSNEMISYLLKGMIGRRKVRRS